MAFDLSAMREMAHANIADAASAAALAELKVQLLGKKGEITALLKMLSQVPPEDRRALGASINQLKDDIEEAIRVRTETLEQSTSAFSHPQDVTLPGMGLTIGSLHPTIQMMYDLNDAFRELNFDIYEGPELSDEYFDFDCLNFPPDHPARESMDTYWLAETEGAAGKERLSLRPHLTGASVRYMLEHRPPFRVAYPGRVYRNESTDARHERAFFQYEALIVDDDISFTAGRLLINAILDQVFGRHVNTRMRAGFFPFVEPGFEIDMECLVCSGRGCKVCKEVGWLEVMPGGMPHPNVLRSGGIDPDRWTGFYINVGLDRLTMMRYAIDDVRLFHSADLRFLRQFS